MSTIQSGETGTKTFRITVADMKIVRTAEIKRGREVFLVSVRTETLLNT
jgi:hypothetical protein